VFTQYEEKHTHSKQNKYDVEDMLKIEVYHQNKAIECLMHNNQLIRRGVIATIIRVYFLLVTEFFYSG
jgi:hypothetical protein